MSLSLGKCSPLSEDVSQTTLVVIFMVLEGDVCHKVHMLGINMSGDFLSFSCLTLKTSLLLIELLISMIECYSSIIHFFGHFSQCLLLVCDTGVVLPELYA